jgi:hypothetical protein
MCIGKLFLAPWICLFDFCLTDTVGATAFSCAMKSYVVHFLSTRRGCWHLSRSSYVHAGANPGYSLLLRFNADSTSLRTLIFYVIRPRGKRYNGAIGGTYRSRSALVHAARPQAEGVSKGIELRHLLQNSSPSY